MRKKKSTPSTKFEIDLEDQAIATSLDLQSEIECYTEGM